MVKVSYTANGRGGSWRAHGHYLGRKGAQREGERGTGFDATRDEIALPDRLDAWQKAGDLRLWKVVLSPEAASRTDLRRHAREVIARMESDLGTRLEWVAIDHHDTEHPHVHLAIRGVDERGRPLVLPREYVRSGIRARSQELLTRDLGYRHERDRLLSRERAIAAARPTEIDRSLLARAGASGELSFGGALPLRGPGRERRLQDLRRLHFLADLGLAEKTGPRAWRLSPQMGAGLRQLQIAGDIQKSLALSRSLITDRNAPIQLTRLAPGDELTGRVAGAGFDEGRDEPFLIVEGTDGVRHVLTQTPEIQRARGAGLLRPGIIVSLRSRPTGSPGSSRIRIVSHGRLRDLRKAPTAATLVDLEALRALRTLGRPPDPVAGRRGFFQQWRAAVIRRIPLLEREGLVRKLDDRGTERTHEVAEGAEQMVEARMAEHGRTARPLEKLEKLHGRRIEVVSPDAGRRLRGELVAYAERAGQHFAVIATDRGLHAVATERLEIAIGRQVQVRAQAVRAEAESRERRQLVWTLDDLEQQRDHGRGR